jgi:hypothetical protein
MQISLLHFMVELGAALSIGKRRFLKRVISQQVYPQHKKSLQRVNCLRDQDILLHIG